MVHRIAHAVLRPREVGIFQDLVWRAIRASTSMPGILPPVCSGDELLVDGGVVSNVPVDVMRARLGRRLNPFRRPALGSYGALDFKAGLEIAEAGYRSAAEALERTPVPVAGR